MLSWGAEKTLLNSLTSYAKYNFLDLLKDKVIFLQETSHEQIQIAHQFGFRTLLSAFNVGIARAYRDLVESAKESDVLFLENDWELISDNAGIQIGLARYLYDEGVDLIRFRHRWKPGNPLWTRQFEGHEYDRPTHLLDAVHWSHDMPFDEIRHKVYDYYQYGFDLSFAPESAVVKKSTTFYITSSKYANWTNNPHMASTQFLKENVLPHIGTGNIEADFQQWWEQQDFTVAQGDGLFTHNRLY